MPEAETGFKGAVDRAVEEWEERACAAAEELKACAQAIAQGSMPVSDRVAAAVRAAEEAWLGVYGALSAEGVQPDLGATIPDMVAAWRALRAAKSEAAVFMRVVSDEERYDAALSDLREFVHSVSLGELEEPELSRCREQMAAVVRAASGTATDADFDVLELTGSVVLVRGAMGGKYRVDDAPDDPPGPREDGACRESVCEACLDLGCRADQVSDDCQARVQDGGLEVAAERNPEAEPPEERGGASGPIRRRDAIERKLDAGAQAASKGAPGAASDGADPTGPTVPACALSSRKPCTAKRWNKDRNATTLPNVASDAVFLAVSVGAVDEALVAAVSPHGAGRMKAGSSVGTCAVGEEVAAAVLQRLEGRGYLAQVETASGRRVYVATPWAVAGVACGAIKVRGNGVPHVAAPAWEAGRPDAASLERALWRLEACDAMAQVGDVNLVDIRRLEDREEPAVCLTMAKEVPGTSARAFVVVLPGDGPTSGEGFRTVCSPEAAEAGARADYVVRDGVLIPEGRDGGWMDVKGGFEPEDPGVPSADAEADGPGGASVSCQGSFGALTDRCDPETVVLYLCFVLGAVDRRVAGIPCVSALLKGPGRLPSVLDGLVKKKAMLVRKAGGATVYVLTGKTERCLAERTGLSARMRGAAGVERLELERASRVLDALALVEGIDVCGGMEIEVDGSRRTMPVVSLSKRYGCDARFVLALPGDVVGPCDLPVLRVADPADPASQSGFCLFGGKLHAPVGDAVAQRGGETPTLAAVAPRPEEDVVHVGASAAEPREPAVPASETGTHAQEAAPETWPVRTGAPDACEREREDAPMQLRLFGEGGPDTGAHARRGAATGDLDAREAASVVLNAALGGGTPSDEELGRVFSATLAECAVQAPRRLAEARVLARAGACVAPQGCCSSADALLAMAGVLPMPGDCPRTGAALAAASSGGADEALLLAATIGCAFSPKSENDFTLIEVVRSSLERYNEDFPSFLEAKALLSELSLMLSAIRCGFSEAFLNEVRGAEKSAPLIDESARTVRDLVEAPRRSVNFKLFAPLSERLFGKRSDVRAAIDAVGSGERDLVMAFLSDYMPDGLRGGIDASVVESAVEAAWSDVRENERFELQYATRDCMVSNLERRVESLAEWARLTEPPSGDAATQAMREARAKVVLAAEAVRKAYAGSAGGRWVVGLAAGRVADALQGAVRPKNAYAAVLGHLDLGFDVAGRPLVAPAFDDVRGFELWRRALKSIAGEPVPFKVLADSEGSPAVDDLNRRRLARAALAGSAPAVDGTAIARARGLAEERHRELRAYLELAFAEGRIGEADRDRLVDAAARASEGFYEALDFSLWKRFLDALRDEADALGEKRARELRADIERTAEDEPCEAPILSEALKMCEKGNLAVAEEYANLYKLGIRAVPRPPADGVHLKGFLGGFADKAREEIRRFPARSRRRTSDALRDAMKKVVAGAERTTGDADDVAGRWPGSDLGREGASRVGAFLAMVGLSSGECCWVDEQRVKTYKVQLYSAEAVSAPRGLDSYGHPVAAFGTRAPDRLTVACLPPEVRGGKAVYETLTALGRSEEFFVALCDDPMGSAERRALSQAVHENLGVASAQFVVVDPVLACYLAGVELDERVPALLECTLCSCVWNPFNESTGAVDDEMFFGRREELGSILDPRGASIVYGGRQLGKTALLQRAEKIVANREGQTAVFVSALEAADEEGFAHVVGEALEKSGLVGPRKWRTVDDVAAAVRSALADSSLKYLLLLVDECDAFLASMDSDRYARLRALVAAQRESGLRFKFVFAGTHNVVRFSNALEANSVLGQIGSLSVGPLSPQDGLGLLWTPLSYAGFSTGDGAHLQTTLANTNAFPGILQMFGRILIEDLNKNYPDGAQGRSVPPFPLDGDTVGRVMNDSRLNETIRDKLMLTLRLDGGHYMALALSVAALDYLHEGSAGPACWSASEIAGVARGFSEALLEGADDARVRVLLDEMAQMNVLSKTGGDYGLRRRCFREMLGPTYDSVVDELTELADDAEGGRQ